MNNLPRSRPFRTSPPTIARRNSTTHLPHSFAAYHFAQTSFSEIRERFNKHADLRLEVWQRDGTASDRVLGEGVLHLPDLLTAEEVQGIIHTLDDAGAFWTDEVIQALEDCIGDENTANAAMLRAWLHD